MSGPTHVFVINNPSPFPTVLSLLYIDDLYSLPNPYKVEFGVRVVPTLLNHDVMLYD